MYDFILEAQRKKKTRTEKEHKWLNFESWTFLWLIKLNHSINILIYQASGIIRLYTMCHAHWDQKKITNPSENWWKTSITYLILFYSNFVFSIFCGQSFSLWLVSSEDWLKFCANNFWGREKLWTLNMLSFTDFGCEFCFFLSSLL